MTDCPSVVAPPINTDAPTIASPSLPSVSSWPSNCPPLVEVQMVPIPQSGTITTSFLTSNELTFYLYPSNALYAYYEMSGGDGWYGQYAKNIKNGGVYAAACGGYSQDTSHDGGGTWYKDVSTFDDYLPVIL